MRNRLTYANVVVSLAPFVACGRGPLARQC